MFYLIAAKLNIVFFTGCSVIMESFVAFLATKQKHNPGKVGGEPEKPVMNKGGVICSIEKELF